MDLSWYDRVAGDFETRLRESCPLINELIDDELIEIRYNRLNKHPSIAVAVFEFSDPEELSAVIPICFDPYNQEFYSSAMREDNKLRIMFESTVDLFEHVYEVIHNLIEDDLDDYETNEHEEEQHIDWLLNNEFVREFKTDIPLRHSKLSFKIGKNRETGDILIRKSVTAAALDGKEVELDHSILELDEEASKYIIQTIKDNYLAS